MKLRQMLRQATKSRMKLLAEPSTGLSSMPPMLRTKPTRRFTTIAIAVLAITVIVLILIIGALIPDSANEAEFEMRNLPPSLQHPFGTDWLGRDMLLRTIEGLSMSLVIGIVASACSAIIALILGVTAAMGMGKIDHALNWLVDLHMSVPHTVLLMLISVSLNRGILGLMVGIAITHWTGLARIIRGEVLQIRSKNYITASIKLGKSRAWIARTHILPHLVPQFFIGLVLMFPHAIMHESGLSFLGYGLPPDQPAIGLILAEASRYLFAGSWWLTLFPGFSLVLMVLLVDKIGENLKLLASPSSANR
jgi:peptide/nickel transport system permease protein